MKNYKYKCRLCNRVFYDYLVWLEHEKFELCNKKKTKNKKKDKHTFIKYVIIGVIFTSLGALLSTITGVLFYNNPKLLFIINFVFVNTFLFLIKYYVSKKARIIA